MNPCCCNTHDSKFSTFMELYPKLVTLGHYNYLSIYMNINDLLYVYLDSNIELDKINKQLNFQLFSSGKSVFQLNGIRSCILFFSEQVCKSSYKMRFACVLFLIVILCAFTIRRTCIQNCELHYLLHCTINGFQYGVVFHIKIIDVKTVEDIRFSILIYM